MEKENRTSAGRAESSLALLMWGSPSANSFHLRVGQEHTLIETKKCEQLQRRVHILTVIYSLGQLCQCVELGSEKRTGTVSCDAPAPFYDGAPVEGAHPQKPSWL